MFFPFSLRFVVLRLFFIGLGALTMGCVDPLRQEAIADLGDEVSGVAPGPLHRQGQPCLTCHDGAISTPFSLAGTIYLRSDGAQPASSAIVSLANGLGEKYHIATNCAGNFFVRPGDFDAVWPVWVRIEHDGWAQEMESPINANGSCASCHAPTTSPKSAGPIFVLPFAGESEEPMCP